MYIGLLVSGYGLGLPKFVQATFAMDSRTTLGYIDMMIGGYSLESVSGKCWSVVWCWRVKEVQFKRAKEGNVACFSCSLKGRMHRVRQRQCTYTDRVAATQTGALLQLLGSRL